LTCAGGRQKQRANKHKLLPLRVLASARFRPPLPRAHARQADRQASAWPEKKQAGLLRFRAVFRLQLQHHTPQSTRIRDYYSLSYRPATAPAEASTDRMKRTQRALALTASHAPPLRPRSHCPSRLGGLYPYPRVPSLFLLKGRVRRANEESSSSLYLFARTQTLAPAAAIPGRCLQAVFGCCLPGRAKNKEEEQFLAAHGLSKGMAWCSNNKTMAWYASAAPIT
jgi:hypothetical protein